MGRTVRGSNSSGGQIFRILPDRPWDPSSLLYNRYLFFPRVNGVETRHWPPIPSTAEVKEGVICTSTPPLGLHGLFFILLHTTKVLVPLISCNSLLQCKRSSNVFSSTEVTDTKRFFTVFHNLILFYLMHAHTTHTHPHTLLLQARLPRTAAGLRNKLPYKTENSHAY